jgi:hypothetical protein
MSGTAFSDTIEVASTIARCSAKMLSGIQTDVGGDVFVFFSGLYSEIVDMLCMCNTSNSSALLNQKRVRFYGFKTFSHSADFVVLYEGP